MNKLTPEQRLYHKQQMAKAQNLNELGQAMIAYWVAKGTNKEWIKQNRSLYESTAY